MTMGEGRWPALREDDRGGIGTMKIYIILAGIF
jgi:hypothetical protein